MADQNLFEMLAKSARQVADAVETLENRRSSTSAESVESSEPNADSPKSDLFERGVEIAKSLVPVAASATEATLNSVVGIAETLVPLAKNAGSPFSASAESSDASAASEQSNKHESQATDNVEPAPPAPTQIPESFGPEVLRARDLVLYRNGLVKGNRVVYYRSATRVLLKSKVSVPPEAPEYRGLSVGDGVEAGMELGRAVNLTPDAEILGKVAGAALGGAIGVLAKIAPTPEDHNQIWLETDDSSEPLLLYSEKIKDFWETNAMVTRLCDEIEKAQKEPKILLDGKIIKRKYGFCGLYFYRRKTFFKIKRSVREKLLSRVLLNSR